MATSTPLVVLAAAAVLASGCAAVDLGETDVLAGATKRSLAHVPIAGAVRAAKKKKRNGKVRRGSRVKKPPTAPGGGARPSDPPSDSPPSDSPPPSCEGECGPLVGLLAAHNTARAAVGVPALVWDANLSAHATDWANQLASNGCQLEHRGNSPYGENLYWSTQPKPAAHVVAAWTGESAAYDSASHSCSAQTCGHYLQVVWSTTTRVGCGMATCGQTQVWVCNYDPRGLQPGQQPF